MSRLPTGKPQVKETVSFKHPRVCHFDDPAPRKGETANRSAVMFPPATHSRWVQTTFRAVSASRLREPDRVLILQAPRHSLMKLLLVAWAALAVALQVAGRRSVRNGRWKICWGSCLSRRAPAGREI